MNKSEWNSIDAGWQRDMDVHLALFGPRQLTEIFIVEELPHYTSDRNACALVLDEIENRDLEFVFIKELVEEIGAQDSGDLGWTGKAIAYLRILTADPDTICYCAVKVLRSKL